jgi:hypothetical protein
MKTRNATARRLRSWRSLARSPRESYPVQLQERTPFNVHLRWCVSKFAVADQDRCTNAIANHHNGHSLGVRVLVSKGIGNQWAERKQPGIWHRA